MKNPVSTCHIVDDQQTCTSQKFSSIDDLGVIFYSNFTFKDY